MYQKDLTAVGLYEAELRDKLNRRNDEDMVLADLTGLFVEIIGEISKTDKSKSIIIYDYAKLLEQELQLYSGADAYIAGRGAKDKSEWNAFVGYMRAVAEVNGARRLDSLIQSCFNEMVSLLGDKSGLITEFTETYSRVHGVVKNNIIDFIRMGQASGSDEPLIA